MRIIHIHSLFIGLILHFTTQVSASGNQVIISNDKSVVLGATITFKADLFLSDGSRPSGTFVYNWKDNARIEHSHEVTTTNTTSYWTISYPGKDYSVGPYRIEVTVQKDFWKIFPKSFGRSVTDIDVTNLLNGNITIEQSNKTLNNEYVSTKSEAEIQVSLQKGDYDYVESKATSISTFWFVDCRHYGQSDNFTFNYHFTQPETSHVVEALVIASFDPPTTTTTTIAPTTPMPTSTTPNPNTTTIAPTTPMPTSTTPNPNTTTIASTTTTKSMISTTPVTQMNNNNTDYPFGNNSFPFVCQNSSIIPPEPNKTYGYFFKEVKVRAPISNITVDGTPWLQPWEMLSLNVSCKGSGPFGKCLMVRPGQYNVTGNETCTEGDKLDSCNFSILHYFLDPGVYTIIVILNNDVSEQIYPLTINIYKVTKKPQLSVIIVPVSCSLAAVVLIVFGVAYYIQSRARFTVEVADFDFGQYNPEMEYKTFTERLKDSFNSALRPGGGGGSGGDRVNGYEPLNKPLLN